MTATQEQPALRVGTPVDASHKSPSISGYSADPFGLRGIKLGITLAEFKAMRHPDGLQAQVICSDEPNSHRLSLFRSGDETFADVVLCKMFEPSSWSSGWIEVGLNVATVNVFMTYKFVPDPRRNGRYALYKMIIRSNVGYWDKFWDGYTGKYGRPDKISNSPTQNRAGATFDNATAIWENNQSSITLIKRFDRIDNTYIFYLHGRLAAEVRRRIEQEKGKPSDKL